MKRISFLSIIVVIFFIVLPAFADQVKIPERTVVPVKLTQHLKGDDLLVGQSVDFEVSRDIMIDDFIVIKRGAPAYATVTAVDEAGYVSQGGKISLSIDYCKAVDGNKVYLKSVIGQAEEDHMGANVAASVLLCPLILAAKGDEAEMSEGTEFRSYVENDVFVEVLADKKPTE